MLAKRKFKYPKYELLKHPSYSADLAPVDFNLFPVLNKLTIGKRFESNGEMIAEKWMHFWTLPASELV